LIREDDGISWPLTKTPSHLVNTRLRSIMSRPLSSQPPSPIQRLLIFHLNFAEKCMNGHALDEGASLEELHEQILFYHRDRRLTDNSEEIDGTGSSQNVSYHDDNGDLIQEAVQFVGLCTALHSLPDSLGEAELQGDRTKEVYFGDSTLVFVPLESSSSDILAVAQVSRLYLRGSKSDIGGGNPFAVRSSIERCHKLFCLLRGGGIIHRLQSTNSGHSLQKNGTQSAYPGMGQLYTLRRELRRLQNRSSRLSDSAEDERTSIDEQSGRLEADIQALTNDLPIQLLRRDMGVHYNEYLGDLSVVVSRIGGSARCLVETIPAPLAVPSGMHVLQCPPVTPSTYCSVNLGLAVRQILDEIECSGDKTYRLLGISSFLHGQLIFTHAQASILSHLESSIQRAEITNETACLLMGYVTSYSSKIDHHGAPSHSNSVPQRPPQQRLGLKRLTFSFGALVDEAPHNLNDGNESSSNEDDQRVSGRFLSPPPLFMLSPLDRTHSFEGPNNTKVWAPLIHLPLLLVCEYKVQYVEVDAFAIRFELRDFSFLIYFMSRTQEDPLAEGTISYLPRLEDLALGLSDAVHSAAGEGDSVGTSSDASDFILKSEVVLGEWDELGQDVIFVNRSQHKMILFSDRKQAAVKSRVKQRAPGRKTPRRFLGFGTDSKTTRPDKSASPSREPSRLESDWSALGLDCRHRLASHLPLDIVLAFDDMMNEVRKVREGKQIADSHRRLRWPPSPSNSNDDRCVELCTCMRQGWIYAFTQNEHELYAFFDDSIYVTVADVQSAARRIRKRLFGEWSI
jgi:hypothetical protein